MPELVGDDPVACEYQLAPAVGMLQPRNRGRVARQVSQRSAQDHRIVVTWIEPLDSVNQLVASVVRGHYRLLADDTVGEYRSIKLTQT